MPRVILRFFGPVLVSIFAALSSHAVDSGLESLIKNSPFGTSSTAQTNSKNEAPLEFRGVLTESGIAYFSIYESATSRSAWVKLNQDDARSYIAKDYDWETRKLTVSYQGRDLVLDMAADSSPAPIPAAVQPSPNPADPTATNTTSEAQRLSNIAAEIKRRRALRQQSINQTRK